MASKIQSLSLEELLDRPKITPSIEAAIVSKMDFSTIQPSYCDKVCKLKCKAPDEVTFLRRKVEVLIIQDHKELPGKYDKRPGQQDDVQAGVIGFLCKLAGFPEGSYRITSLLKCPATYKDFVTGKPPTQTVLRKCAPYLYKEIESCAPKAIISLGTATTKALGMKNYSNTGNRGHIGISKFGIPVVCSLHPKILTFIRQNARGSAGMWGPDYLKVIQNDFSKALKLARGELTWSEDSVKNATAKLKETGAIRIARSLEEVEGFMKEIMDLPESQIVSFDTETTNLDVMDPSLRILTIQFGWKKPDGQIVAVVIPLWHRDNTAYEPEEAWKLVVPYLLSNRPKVGHNAKYDILAIYWAKGVRVVNVAFDTLLLIHSIYSGAQGTYSLKTATWDYLPESGLGGYEDQLGDLKKLQKAHDKAVKLAQKEEEIAEEEVEEQARIVTSDDMVDLVFENRTEEPDLSTLMSSRD